MINKFLCNFKTSAKGASLIEFAVTTALMATLAVTAAPKMSSLTEDTKVRKSIENIDKILFASKKFYEETSNLEGRGRFPGQEKFDFPVGKYTDELRLISDLESYTSYEKGRRRGWWRSVFGRRNPDASMPTGSKVANDRVEDCNGCPVNIRGHDRFIEIFGDPLKSPFQDGHYIYVVIPGGGTGENFYPPILYVADMENPSQLYNLLVP